MLARPPIEIDGAQDRGAAGDGADALGPILAFGGNGVADAFGQQFGHGLFAADEIEHVDTLLAGELGQHLADRAVGGVLDDPVARLHVEIDEQAHRAHRHGGQLAGGGVVDLGRHHRRPAALAR